MCLCVSLACFILHCSEIWVNYKSLGTKHYRKMLVGWQSNAVAFLRLWIEGVVTSPSGIFPFRQNLRRSIVLMPHPCGYMPSWLKCGIAYFWKYYKKKERLCLFFLSEADLYSFKLWLLSPYKIIFYLVIWHNMHLYFHQKWEGVRIENLSFPN